MSRRIQTVLLAVAVVSPTAAIAVADPGLTDVPAHRHYIAHPNGERSEVGPRVCDDPSLQESFNQFHNNGHRATPSSQGPAAPGLHDGRGGEITFGGC